MVISLYPRNGGTYMGKKESERKMGHFFPWYKKITELAAKDDTKSDLKILSENRRHVHNIADDGVEDILSGCHKRNTGKLNENCRIQVNGTLNCLTVLISHVTLMDNWKTYHDLQILKDCCQNYIGHQLPGC